MASDGGLRVYRFLLRLFPSDFRRERGREMEELFQAMRRERGGRVGLSFWVPLMWDTASQALRERLGRRRPGGGSLGAGLATELRAALRSVARQPTYGALVVLMMALGIAGNAAVFRVFNGLFLRPLPFEEPQELVDLDVRSPRWNLDYVSVAYTDYHAWREGNETFEDMAVYTVRGANLAGAEDAVWVDVLAGTWTLPGVLGLDPAVGRFFTEEEDQPGGALVAVLSQGLWERRFGRRADVVGRTLELDGEAYQIVGVLGSDAAFLERADVWIPLQGDPDVAGGFYLTGVGRLRPDATLDRAAEDLTRVHKARVQERPVNRGTFPVVSSLRDRYLGEHRLGGGVLLAAVGIILLMACANIAGLMLARSVERGREVGVRLAMGAPRGRIVAQVLLESLVLAGIGALLGVSLGVWGSSLLVDRIAEQFPRWVAFDLDARFVAFSVAVTVGAALLFGLAPALRSSGLSPTTTLRGASTRTTASRRRRRAMSGLIAGEVALAVLLLVGSALAMKDLRALQSTDPGFRTENVLSYRIALPGARYEALEARLAFYREHLERLRALPGVTGAGATTVLPLAGHSGWFFEAEGAPPRDEGESNPVVLSRAVSPGYLEANDVRLLAGRTLDDFDGRDEDGWVAVVNESFVREFLRHVDDPIGARIRTGGEGEPWRTVVGVNADVKHYGLDEEMRPGVWQPLRQFPSPSVHVTVRTVSEPNELLVPVRASLQELDPGIAPFDVATMDERLDDSLWSRRAASWLMAAFSVVALLLAVAGLYGVISYTVGQRTQEIGIRMALGARRRSVLGRVLLQGMTAVAVGAGVGLAVAAATAPLVASLLTDGISPTDPGVYLGVTALLLGVAALANLVPALRASRLDPMGVLRRE